MVAYQLNIGDRKIAYDFESNILDYGFTAFNDFKFDSFHSIKYTIINFTSFIECYSKYEIGKNNPSLIWKKPKDFDVDKHVNGDFSSIVFEDAIRNSNLFTNDEIILLSHYYKDIRNKFVHYSLNATDHSTTLIEPTIILYDEIISMFEILRRLLIEAFTKFDKYSLMSAKEYGLSLDIIKNKKCPYKY